MVGKLLHLHADHEQRRDQKRQHVIDDPVENKAAENLIDIDSASERRNDDRLEHAQPRRNVAENAGTDSCGIDRQERRPADIRLRQKHVKNRRRGSDIERRDQELLRRGFRIGKPQLQPAQRHFAAIPAGNDKH